MRSLVWAPLRERYPADAPRPDLVVNFAGVTGAGPGLSANTDLALAGFATGATRMIAMSSAAVYGPTADAPASEDGPVAPAGEYGRSKLAMEAALLRHVKTTADRALVLRLGNIAGADALLGAARPGARVVLDRFGTRAGGPIRSYIGPVTLARVLRELAVAMLSDRPLPDVLNVAAPGAVAMGDLLDAAGLDWGYRPAGPQAIERVVLDTARLQGIVPLGPETGDAAGIVAEWRAVAQRRT
ncbi:MAG: NAD-dependent epimerase/dehydratase family protein [Paracoccaceae bacterium]